ncbi:MAG: DNA polymerase I [Clostridia bacterium]|nr:DNA polymerase I [Clostridia bacterium]
MKKILVIDGNSIINRAFYGIRMLTTKDGKHTNAIYGMINIIQNQLETIKPDYAAVAFDLHAPTFRKKMYPAYKEGRHPTPEELLSQFDDAKECLRLMGLSTLELEGYEADDIQGTIASMANSDDELFSYILSGDRDLLQLITDKVNVLLATNSDTVLYDRNAFFEKYGVEPPRLVDAKALMGDSSDNIPGVAGVGEKTAFKLLSEFGSLDGIYENIDSPSIAKGVREKLLRDKETAYLSYELAKIDTNSPIKESLEDIAFSGMNKGALYKKFKELEFNALIRKFGLSEADTLEAEVTPAAEEKATKEDSYQADLFSVFEEKPAEKLSNEYKEVTLSDLKEKVSSLFAIQIKDENAYISTKEENLIFSGELSSLAFLFERDFICFDAKAMYHALRKHEITLASPKKDLMLYSYVIDSSKGQRSLSSIALEYLGYELPEDKPYAHTLLPLFELLCKRAEKDSCLSIIEKIELPLSLLLAEMEEAGFQFDRIGMQTFSDELTKRIDETTERIYELAGLSFNINSPKQLAQVLVDELGIPLRKKTKSGYSTDVETLEQVKLYHPIINEILEYRKLTKLNSTYAVGLLKAADENGRVHTDFRQALTVTGRLSSTEPNLQNVPIKTALGRRIREQFEAKEGYLLVDADYSQIELRLLACLSGDEIMTEAFANGEDIHKKTASVVFGIPEEAVTEEYRKRAKAVNFGIVYGMGAYSLSGDLGISVGQAKEYIESYFEKYPKIREFLNASVQGACEFGYTETLFGRRRYIPELSSSRKQLQEFGKRAAMNSPLQGTAADVMKIAMLNVARRLKEEKLDAKLVMQVHDEIIVEAREDCAEYVGELVKAEMENAVLLPVVLTADVSVGKKWI